MTITEKQVIDINNLLRHSIKAKLNANTIVYINNMIEEAQKELLEELYNKAKSKPYPNHTSLWDFENKMKELSKDTKEQNGK